MKARIADIKVGERSRKDMGDIAQLAASIRENGLVQPVIVTSDMALIAGERRLTAARSLGWSEIEVHVSGGRDDTVSLLRAERAENTCRKEMTPEEMVRSARQIEAAERAAARERQREGQRRGGGDHRESALGSADPKAPQDESRRTNSQIAEAVGLGSRGTYDRINAVVNAADDDPDPEVRQIARTNLDQLNAGQIGAETAARAVREARRKDTPTPEREDKPVPAPAPPKKKGPGGRLHQDKRTPAVLTNTVGTLESIQIAIDPIAEHGDLSMLTDEEAARIMRGFQSAIKSLKAITDIITKGTQS